MGIRDLWRRDKKQDPPKDQKPKTDPPVDDVLLRALLGNETITREMAMTLPAVSGAVDFIANTVAAMPVRLYQRFESGGKEEGENQTRKTTVEEQPADPRVLFLNGDTGDTLDAFQMKKAMVEDYLMGKGGYCYIRRRRNDVTGLFYVEDRSISFEKITDPIKKDYRISVNGARYKPWEFIKLLRNTKDGASGIGLTDEVGKMLETAYQTLIYQLALVKSGGNKKGFLKAKNRLGQDEINLLKAAWRKLYANNEENVVVLNNGMEFQEASNSSVEMQLNESKRTLTDEINALFHISSDFTLTFKEAIYPIVKAFETALNRDLLLEKEKGTYFFALDVKEIVKADLIQRYQAYKIAKETGFMTLNEIRTAENMNRIDGLDVINVGLGAVLYDTVTKTYYTPNTGATGTPGEAGDKQETNPENGEKTEEQEVNDDGSQNQE